MSGDLTLEQAERLVLHIYDGDSAAIADLLAEAEANPAYVLGFLADVTGSVARLITTGDHRARVFSAPRSRTDALVPSWLQLVAAATNEDAAMVTAHVQSICNGPESTYRTSLVQIMGMLRDLMRINERSKS